MTRPCDGQRGQQRDRQEPVRGREPARPLDEEGEGALHEHDARGLGEPGEPPDEPALDLRGGGGRQRRADGRVAEGHERRQQDHRHRDEDQEPAHAHRARDQQRRHEEDRLRARERGERREDRGGQRPVARVREQRGGDQRRRERDLHPRQGAPRQRARPHECHARAERGGRRRAQGDGGTAGQDPGPDGREDAERLRERERRPEGERAGREEERPQRRRRARHRHPRVVREPGALGEVAREVEVDPGVVEREAGAPRDLPLAEQEDRERDERGEGDDEVSASRARAHGGAAPRAPACTRRTRPAAARAEGRRGSGREAARSRRAPAGARRSGSSGRRTTRAA